MTITYNNSSVEYSSFDYTYNGTSTAGNLANLPVLGVFIAFDSGVYDAEPAWVEVTQYVRSVSINRGRVDELEPFQGGKATVVLDNNARLFDPFNTAGTYYGKLLPRKQIKIVAQWNALNNPLFRGFVSGFPVEWTDAGKDSTCTVDCFDMISLLGAENINDDLAYDYIQSLNPLCFIKNDVKQNVSTSANAGGVTISSSQPNYGSVGGNLNIQEIVSTTGSNAGSGSVNAGSGIMGLTDSPALSVTGDNLAFIDLAKNLFLTQVPDLSTTQYTMVFWVKIDPTMEAGNNWSGTPNVAQLINTDYVFEDSGTNDRICLCLNSSVAPVGSIMVFNYGTVIASSYQAINDGEPHCVAITFEYRDSNIYRKIFIDGVDTTLTSSPSSINTSIGRTKMFVRGSNQSASFGYAAIFKGVLTNDQILTMALLGNNDIVETADARFRRLMAFTSVPSELTETDSDFTYTNVQNLPKVGSALLPALQQLATSESSPLFVDASGILQFWSRDTIYGRYPSPYIDLADDGTGMPYANRAVRVMLDGDAVRNAVTVTDSLDRAITATNEASITANGIAAETFDTVLVDVDSATELAERMVTIFADPDMDLEPIVVQGQRDPNYWTYLLGLDLLFKFSFKRTPPVGSQISREMLVQQLVWNITPSTWEVSIKGSARYTGWFTVGLSLVGGSDVVL